MRRPGTWTLLIAAAVVGASCSEPSSGARHSASATIAPLLADLHVAAALGADRARTRQHQEQQPYAGAHSTVTLFARLRGRSTSQPRRTAM